MKISVYECDNCDKTVKQGSEDNSWIFIHEFYITINGQYNKELREHIYCSKECFLKDINHLFIDAGEEK